MNKQQFSAYIRMAKARNDDWARGYQRGLRRHYHGDRFGTEAEHEQWMAMDGQRAELGDGYRTGFAGMPPSELSTSAERVAAFDARLARDGGRKLSGIRLNPAAAAALSALEKAGESATAAINRLLTEADER